MRLDHCPLAWTEPQQLGNQAMVAKHESQAASGDPVDANLELSKKVVHYQGQAKGNYAPSTIALLPTPDYVLEVDFPVAIRQIRAMDTRRFPLTDSIITAID